ncbi:MAG: diphosphomevalonate decarboxylase [Anaerolineae bacterium]|nr:diphosphomevalonate decarboxylase [Anaerolineae bacterium]
MTNNSASAISHPNIAFIKYWGNKNEKIRIPKNNSISMNLDGLETRTRVTFGIDNEADQLVLNGEEIDGEGRERVSRLLDQVRITAGISDKAKVESTNNFPTGSGIASSASAFAALSLAASAAAGLSPNIKELSKLARTGSGSACRSVPAGFVEWFAGQTHEDSFAASIAPADHWDLVDCIAVVSQEHKATGSTGGHAIAGTSPLQEGRVADAQRRLDLCREAILSKDFKAFAEITELDSTMMHAVMMTSTPSLYYWQAETLRIMQAVQNWRMDGLQACFTIDAGPNVHVICPAEHSAQVAELLTKLPGVQKVLSAKPGGPTKLIPE